MTPMSEGVRPGQTLKTFRRFRTIPKITYRGRINELPVSSETSETVSVFSIRKRKELNHG